ncbi:MAG TPA: DUF2520 domain-containing protein [Acidimicrobiia bacterium]|nr:DUF2520 domain-containing protein [Acidimicrobiia bacterium]
MNLLICGPGRAGGALALAASAAGHDIAGFVSRSPLPAGLAGRYSAYVYGDALPPTELLVVAVRDGAISEVSQRLAEQPLEAHAAIHLSGFTAVTGLAALEALGIPVGSFHPLQTLPNPEDGSRALAGSWAGITAEPPLRGRLVEFAASLGMHHFDLNDEAKPAYHAAASAASNFVVAALAIAADLFEAAHVPLSAARPLTEQVTRNVFDLGGGAALTGPIARGDWETVRGQLVAADDAGVGAAFRLLAEATAAMAGVSIPAAVRR